MSIALYERRLFWDGEHGCAKAVGVYRSFMTYPKIRGVPPFEFLDFAPEVGTAVIIPRCSHEREITGDEVRALNAYLDALSSMSMGDAS